MMAIGTLFLNACAASSGVLPLTDAAKVVEGAVSVCGA